MVGRVIWMRAIKPQLLVDKNGIPIATGITKPEGSDYKNVLPVIDNIKVLNGKKGRPRVRPKMIVADKGYSAKCFRSELRKRSIRHNIPQVVRNRIKKGVYGRPLVFCGKTYNSRWKIERTIAWFASFRRINVCFDRLAYVYNAFWTVASIIIVLRYF